MKNLINIILLLIFLCHKNINAKEIEKVLFKIEEKLFTSIDLKERKEYLIFLLEDKSKEIKNDKYYLNNLVSVSIFNEIFLLKKELSQNISNKNIDDYYKELVNNKLLTYKYLNQKNIKENIRYDLQKKLILEGLLKKQKNRIFQSNKEELYDIYEIKIEYYSYNQENYKKLEDLLEKINFSNIHNNLQKLKDINFIYNNKKINFNNTVNYKLKKIIKENKKEFIIQLDNNKYIVGKIHKKLKITNNIKFSLVQIIEKENLIDNIYKCGNIKKYKKNKDIAITINKNIDYYKLNKIIKKNLYTLNDQIIIKKDDKKINILLCDIIIDEENIKNYNLNSRINIVADQMEKNIIDDFIKNKKFIKYYE